MKIAVASELNQVAGHFGHCESFNVYTVDNNEITKHENIKNPGHRPGFLPMFLHEMGIEVIVSGGMGGGAISIFNEKGIEVIIGTQGEAKTAVEKYLRGELESTGSVCNHHEHSESCVEH